MAIDLHTTYSLNLADPTYRGERNFLLKVAENNALRLNPANAVHLAVKLDSKGRPVIGYGYDLERNKGAAKDALAAVGVVLTPGQEAAILSLTSTPLSSVPAALAGLALPSETAATALLDLAAGVREQELTTFVNANGGVLTNSAERAVLLSMWYQTPAYFRVGSGNSKPTNMGHALVSGDRAEVWFEIRYGSSKFGEDGAGVVVRRYAESEIFGLYNERANVQAEEAKSVYRMLQLHRSQVRTYDGSFGHRIGQANTDYGLAGTPNMVRSLLDSLAPAEAALFAELRSIYPSLSNLSEDDYLAIDTYVDPGRTSSRDAISADHTAALFASQYAADGTEISVNNVLIGEGGRDYLLGGKGNDVLLGGTGKDAYFFRSGDGQDVVVDVGGSGTLFRNDQEIALGIAAVPSSGSWASVSSAGDVTTFTRVGAGGVDLQIAFSDAPTDKITIKNFDFAAAASSGYLGIRLTSAVSSPMNPVRTFTGDTQDFDGSTEDGIQAVDDGFGNGVRTAEMVPDRADVFRGSIADEVERFDTRGGNDTVDADGAASAVSSAGGRDIVLAGAGDDVVRGGGNDD